MSNKNPFEIRTEMLQMAKDYMDQSWRMNVEFTRKMFEEGKKTAEEMKEALTPYCLKDMMAKAQEMYSFVSKKE
jgi:predicted translin family RNA/ssDNA-binding protein